MVCGHKIPEDPSTDGRETTRVIVAITVSTKRAAAIRGWSLYPSRRGVSVPARTTGLSPGRGIYCRRAVRRARAADRKVRH